VLPPVKWFYVLVAYLITPLFALPNSYGCGLTDWDMSSMYAKLALFIFAAWAGAEVRAQHFGGGFGLWLLGAYLLQPSIAPLAGNTTQQN